jgi:hypothetical protein
VIDIGAEEITMSWSYGADDAGPALAEVEVYLPIFEWHGYVAYDPQLERVFSLARDAGDAAEIHRDVREQVFEKYDGMSAASPRDDAVLATDVDRRAARVPLTPCEKGGLRRSPCGVQMSDLHHVARPCLR